LKTSSLPRRSVRVPQAQTEKKKVALFLSSLSQQKVAGREGYFFSPLFLYSGEPFAPRGIRGKVPPSFPGNLRRSPLLPSYSPWTTGLITGGRLVFPLGSPWRAGPFFSLLVAPSGRYTSGGGALLPPNDRLWPPFFFSPSPANGSSGKKRRSFFLPPFSR